MLPELGPAGHRLHWTGLLQASYGDLRGSDASFLARTYAGLQAPFGEPSLPEETQETPASESSLLHEILIEVATCV